MKGKNPDVKYVRIAFNLQKKTDREVYDVLNNLYYDNKPNFIKKAVLYYAKHKEAFDDNVITNAPLPLVSESSSDVEKLSKMVESLTAQVSSLTRKNSQTQVKEDIGTEKEDKPATPVKKKNDKLVKENKEVKPVKEVKKEEPSLSEVKNDEISISTETKNTTGNYDDFMSGFFEGVED